jgi:hypothetical protein
VAQLSGNLGACLVVTVRESEEASTSIPGSDETAD